MSQGNRPRLLLPELARPDGGARTARKQPRRYGPRVVLSVQQELDDVLDRLKKGLPPEAYERVLEIMAAEDEQVPTRAMPEDDR